MSEDKIVESGILEQPSFVKMMLGLADLCERSIEEGDDLRFTLTVEFSNYTAEERDAALKEIRDLRKTMSWSIQ